MRSSFRSSVRRRSVLLASGTAVLLAVGGGASAAVAASTPSASASPSASAACAPRLGALLRGGDAQRLRTDLKALRAAPKAERAADRAAVRQKMLTGAYGARVERLARLADGGAAGTVRATLPAALRTDLKALRGLTAKSAERKAAAAAIAAKALAGDYGTAVQTRAEAAQGRVAERCAAKG